MAEVRETDSPEEKFLKLLLKDKKNKLEYFHQQHRVDIAIYNTKTEMLRADIDMLEKELEGK